MLVSYYLNCIFMESVARIVHFISLIWITGILEQQCIMTVIVVIKFQAGSKLDMESHKTLFWDLHFSLYINDLPMIMKLKRI